MRNSSVDRTWTVIKCKWMCIKGGLCLILSFERFKKTSDAKVCVDVRYLGVGVRTFEIARICARHASAVSAYALELVRNRARPRPSTDAPISYHA